MAFQENLNASIYMFSFFRSHDQMFLTVRGAMQCSFRATLGVAPVFVHVFLRTGWGAWRNPTFFFSVNLDFSGGISTSDN